MVDFTICLQQEFAQHWKMRRFLVEISSPVTLVRPRTGELPRSNHDVDAIPWPVPLLQCSKHVEKKKEEKLFNLKYMLTSKSF